MPARTRRSHNKTRLGCANCKKRRIKCDCTHPICEQCKKRGQECSFLLLAPSSRLSTLSKPSPPVQHPTSPLITSTSPSTSSSTTASIAWTNDSQDVDLILRTPSSRASEISRPRSTVALSDLELLSLSPTRAPSPTTIPSLRGYDIWRDARETLSPALQGLLYHYEYTTSLALVAHEDHAKTAWRFGIPELASKHQFLVHHILAVASLHLGRLHSRGPERSAMRNIAASQMNTAIARYRPALENITAENANALFAGATLTAVYFLRTSIMEIDEIRASVPKGTIEPDTEVVDRMLKCIMSVIWGLRGPLAVLISGYQYVMAGEMSSILNRTWWPSVHDHPPLTPQALEEDAHLARISTLWETQSPNPHNAHLSSALTHLREAYALVSVLAEPNSAFPSITSIGYSMDGTKVCNLKDRGAIFFWVSRISREFIRLLESKNREALVIVAYYAVLPGRVRNAWWLEGLGRNMVMAMAMALGRENWGLVEWPLGVLGVDLDVGFGGDREDGLEGEVGEMPMEII